MNSDDRDDVATAAGEVRPPSAAAQSDEDSRIIRAVQQYLEELEAGAAPQRQEFLGVIQNSATSYRSAWMVWSSCTRSARN